MAKRIAQAADRPTGGIGKACDYDTFRIILSDSTGKFEDADSSAMKLTRRLSDFDGELKTEIPARVEVGHLTLSGHKTGKIFVNDGGWHKTAKTAKTPTAAGGKAEAIKELSALLASGKLTAEQFTTAVSML